METSKTLDFSIDVFSPATIPMGRLAEYMLGLAALYGSQASVRFTGLRAGSAILEAEVDSAAVAAVESRLQLVGNPDAPEDLRKAYHSLNCMLKADIAVGQLRIAGGSVLLDFPGRNMPSPKTYRVREIGVLDGVVIRIGGKDSTIPIWLRDADGAIHKCEANSELARELAPHYLRAPIRVTGQGDWLRGEDGNWTLDKFKISACEVLDNTSISDILNAVRLAKGNGWNEIDDPIAAHLLMRSSD